MFSYRCSREKYPPRKNIKIKIKIRGSISCQYFYWKMTIDGWICAWEGGVPWIPAHSSYVELRGALEAALVANSYRNTAHTRRHISIEGSVAGQGGVAYTSAHSSPTG